MTLSLSTNWCNGRIESGEEIADLAMSLGFEELELGYRTTPQQAKGFRARLDQIPVGSVHAFCPVPVSAPQGHPELYSLASFDEEDRKMAVLQLLRTVRFAADMGADTVVAHAGRVACSTWFRKNRKKKRVRAGLKMLEVFKRELESIVPELEKCAVTLALENLPYLEGFPDEEETAQLLAYFPDAPVKAWFDTGHHRVREKNGWLPSGFVIEPSKFGLYRGMHLNDVTDADDDHLVPGAGTIDFLGLKEFACSLRHRVFEPNPEVSPSELSEGLTRIRKMWDGCDPAAKTGLNVKSKS